MGHVEEARDRIRALLMRERRDPSAVDARAFAEIGTAMLLLDDDPDSAVRNLRSAIALARSVGSRLVERVAMSDIAAKAGRAPRPGPALEAFDDILGEWQRDGIWRMEWGTLQAFMELLARLDRHEDLLVLYAAGAASATAPPLYGDQANRLTQAVKRAEKAVGADTAEAARARGRSLSDAQAVAYAQSLVARR